MPKSGWILRLGLALAAAVCAVALCALTYVLRACAAAPCSSPQEIGVLFTYGAIFFAYLYWKAWVCFLPMVVGMARPSGWRFWLVLAVGTALGPLVAALQISIESHGRGRADRVLEFTLPVASLSSLFYLLLNCWTSRSLATRERNGGEPADNAGSLS